MGSRCVRAVRPAGSMARGVRVSSRVTSSRRLTSAAHLVCHSVSVGSSSVPSRVWWIAVHSGSRSTVMLVPVVAFIQIARVYLACTYDFSSCFFPKFKKSTKRSFSREMTYFCGFYGPKTGGGSSYLNFVQKYHKP